jgi:hypothetical protein
MAMRIVLRSVVLLGILLVVAGGPVVVFSGSQWWSRLTASLSAAGQPSAGEEEPIEEVERSVQETLARSVPQPSEELKVEGSPYRDLAAVLRFDVSPGWVIDQWPRVSAGLAHLQLQGYRVPLVTGTATDDVAGALTYYFGPHQRVQEIHFRGTTGNGRKLVRIVTQRHGLVRKPVNDPSLFLYEQSTASGEVISQLRIRPARVVKSSDPRRRFQVSLVLRRPPAER